MLGRSIAVSSRLVRQNETLQFPATVAAAKMHVDSKLEYGLGLLEDGVRSASGKHNPEATAALESDILASMNW